MRIGYVLGISLQTELLILSFCGILYTMLDASVLEFNNNLEKVWKIKMDPQKFSERTENFMKHVISGIVMIRTFTAHIYLGSYIIMLYPLIFEDRPRLVLPWMAIHVLKCLTTDILSILSSLYICTMYKWVKATCWENLLANFICYSTSLYIFCLILTFFQELQKLVKIRQYIDPDQLRARRRRARLLNECKSLDEIKAKRKRPDGIAMPTLLAHPSYSPLNTVKLAAHSKWPDIDVNTYSLKDAAVSGRSFRVSGNILEVFGQRRLSRKDAASEPEGVDKMEEVQKISDLDNDVTKFQASTKSAEIQATMVNTKKEEAVQKTADEPAYSTVSDLLNDPNIALVLNMITGKDEPWESDLNKLKNYDINLTEEDSLWSYTKYDIGNHDKRGSLKLQKNSSFERSWLRPETRDVDSQVASPVFEQAMSSLQEMPKMPSFKIYVPEKETTAPTLEPPSKEDVKAEKQPTQIQPLTINQLYRNEATYPRTYKDDGYTQAYLERQRRQQQSK